MPMTDPRNSDGATELFPGASKLSELVFKTRADYERWRDEYYASVKPDLDKWDRLRAAQQ